MTAIDRALIDVVRQTLTDLPAASSSTSASWNPAGPGWTVRVTPRNPGAAKFGVTHDGDDLVSVVIERTWFEVFPVSDLSDLDYIGAILSAVAAGNFEQSGLGEGFGWLTLANGKSVAVGRLHLPWPRVLCPRRRFSAYD